MRCLAPVRGSVVCRTEGGNAKKKSLYLEALAWVRYRPAVPQSELTAVVVTDISLRTLPHARPYEYLLSVAEPAVMQFSTIYCVLSHRRRGETPVVFQRVALIIHYAPWGGGSKLMNKVLWKISFRQVFTCFRVRAAGIFHWDQELVVKAYQRAGNQVGSISVRLMLMCS